MRQKWQQWDTQMRIDPKTLTGPRVDLLKWIKTGLPQCGVRRAVLDHLVRHVVAKWSHAAAIAI